MGQDLAGAGARSAFDAPLRMQPGPCVTGHSGDRVRQRARQGRSPALILIPSCYDPGTHTDGHDPPGLIETAFPGVAAEVDDLLKRPEHTVRQPGVAHELPEVPDGIQLWRARRDWQDGDVGRHHEPGAGVPAGPIEQRHGTGAWRHGLGDGREVVVHCLDVAPRQNQPRALGLTRDRWRRISRRTTCADRSGRADGCRAGPSGGSACSSGQCGPHRPTRARSRRPDPVHDGGGGRSAGGNRDRGRSRSAGQRTGRRRTRRAAMRTGRRDANGRCHARLRSAPARSGLPAPPAWRASSATQRHPRGGPAARPVLPR